MKRYPSEWLMVANCGQTYICCVQTLWKTLIQRKYCWLISIIISFYVHFINSCFWFPLIGGRGYIIPQLAVYTTYIPLIYCQLGDYMLPTTYYGNQETPLISCCSNWNFCKPTTETLKDLSSTMEFFNDKIRSSPILTDHNLECIPFS